MSQFTIKSAKQLSVPENNAPLLEALLLPFSQATGSVFGLVRINGRPDVRRRRVLEIISTHLTRFQETTAPDANIPRRFEQILSAINEDIREYLETVPPLALNDIHAVIGVVHKHQVFVSGYGTLAALFMHQTAKSRYVIYELDRQLQDADASLDKLFTTVLDGEFHPGDVFYVATRINVREISLNELQEILVTLPPAGALKRVQQHTGIGTVFGAVAFRAIDNSETGPPKKVNPLMSMEHLGKTKDETANLLGDQAPDVPGAISKVTKPLIDRLSSPGTRGAKSFLQRVIQLILKIGTVSLSFFFVFLRGTGKIVWRFIKRREPVKPAASTKPAKPKVKQPFSERIAHISSRLRAQLSRIPTPAKILLVGSTMVVLVFVVSISALNTRTSNQEKEEAFAMMITRIEEKKDAANASLIYDDKTQARKLLNEAAALLETAIPETRSQESDIDRLREELNTAFFTLRGITETTVERLADLTTTLPDAQFTEIVEANGVIFGLTENQQMVRFNELEPRFDVENTTTGAIGVPMVATGAGSNVLFIDSNGRLGRANTTTKTLNPITSGVDGLQSVRDLTVYNDALYILAAGTEQIVKMRPQGDGYEAGTAWITSHTSPLSQAQALAIDGDVYVLNPDKIVRFTSGREVAFTQETVDPPLANASDIYTTIGTEYLYILDITEGRILVFKKDGSFVTQYVSEQIKTAVGMVIREDKRAILFATKTELYTLTATHLLQ